MIRESGSTKTIGNRIHFIPNPLPPTKPTLILNHTIIESYGKAMHRLGQLNEMAMRIPNINRFIKAYIFKEAILSSEIEGINTTIIELYTPETYRDKPKKEIQLVRNYTKSLTVALDFIRDQEFPIVSRVLLAAHETLMQEGDGEKSSPGEYRKQQVSVGGLIPAPAPEIPLLIGDLEKFINDDKTILPLIKAGLAHVQFETIHPFLDGNGRIGRLLIVLMLIKDKLLTEPLIYPSYYFKKYHTEYYSRLDAVRTNGDFEGWILYYLNAIEKSALDALLRAKDIELLENKIKNSITNNKKFPKQENVFNLLSFIFESPIISIQDAAKKLDLTYNATQMLIQKLVDMNVLVLLNEQKRNKLYSFKSYLDLLARNYE